MRLTAPSSLLSSHRNKTKKPLIRHALFWAVSYAMQAMRCAFVVRLGPKTRPSAGQFEGWVEEVDTGKELRFRSDEELLKFLGERFQAVLANELEPRIDRPEDQEKS